MTTSAREEILARIRTALADVPTTEPEPITRNYLDTHVPEDPDTLTDLLSANLTDYRAHVHRCTQPELPAVISRLLNDHGTRTLATPTGLPDHWTADLDRSTVTVLRDDPPLTATRLDQTDTVLTGCTLAIAETGTLILDTSPDQGRRLLTLIPDHHICVVHTPHQIVASLPRAIPLLDPTQPLTWISGPSATSDIELDRVEGVHGPRTLDVILVSSESPSP